MVWAAPVTVAADPPILPVNVVAVTVPVKNASLNFGPAETPKSISPSDIGCKTPSTNLICCAPSISKIIALSVEKSIVASDAPYPSTRLLF